MADSIASLTNNQCLKNISVTAMQLHVGCLLEASPIWRQVAQVPHPQFKGTKGSN